MWRDQDAVLRCTRATLQRCAERIAAWLFRDDKSCAATLLTGALTTIHCSDQNEKETPMPYAVANDKVRLYYEEAGSGTPILFLHEFAADHTNWEPQMRYFS